MLIVHVTYTRTVLSPLSMKLQRGAAAGRRNLACRQQQQQRGGSKWQRWSLPLPSTHTRPPGATAAVGPWPMALAKCIRGNKVPSVRCMTTMSVRVFGVVARLLTDDSVVRSDDS